MDTRPCQDGPYHNRSTSTSSRYCLRPARCRTRLTMMSCRLPFQPWAKSLSLGAGEEPRRWKVRIYICKHVYIFWTTSTTVAGAFKPASMLCRFKLHTLLGSVVTAPRAMTRLAFPWVPVGTRRHSSVTWPHQRRGNHFWPSPEF